MTRSHPVKALTLISFIILLAGFIAFKSGAFDKYIRTNEEASPTDAPEIKHSPSMWSTSKSLIVVDQKIKFNEPQLIDIDSFLKDEVRLRAKNSLNQDSAKKTMKLSPSMLSGSKSGIVIDQKWLFNYDSLKTDSIK